MSKTIAATKPINLQQTVTRNMRIAMAVHGGMSQKNLAEALGITKATMSQKFNGKTVWTLADIEKASELFKVNPEALVAGQGFEPWTSGL